MPQVLLAGKDWKTRALLRAQLIESGLEVEACESVRDALARLEANELLPALLIADLAESVDPSADVDQLAAWAAQVPTWILASRSLIEGKVLKGRGFEMILFRPIDLGELVEQIRQRVEDV